MADETETQGGEQESKGGSKKTPIIVAGIMVLEAALVFAVVSVLSGGPSPASATELSVENEADLEAPVEVLLLDDRFQNMSTGRVWGWKVEVYMKVRQKHVAKVQEIQERDAAEVKSGISMIFRRAEDRHLREPDFATLTRQLTDYVHELFGDDADGLPLVDRVIIAELRGAPEDV